MGDRGALRLVATGDAAEVVSFCDASERAQAEEDIRAEAAAVEAWYGNNPYSTFLLKHGQRPDAGQAAAIGRLMDARVRAADGSMQPPLTKTERHALREARKRKRAEADLRQQVVRLRNALVNLSQNQDAPADVIGYVHPLFDEPVIREQLERAVDWINRFAGEWRRRGTHTDEEVPQHP
jgi:hypothetical protein